MNSRENEDASDEEESDENVSGDNTNEKKKDEMTIKTCPICKKEKKNILLHIKKSKTCEANLSEEQKKMLEQQSKKHRKDYKRLSMKERRRQARELDHQKVKTDQNKWKQKSRAQASEEKKEDEKQDSKWYKYSSKLIKRIDEIEEGFKSEWRVEDGTCPSCRKHKKSVIQHIRKTKECRANMRLEQLESLLKDKKKKAKIRKQKANKKFIQKRKLKETESGKEKLKLNGIDPVEVVEEDKDDVDVKERIEEKTGSHETFREKQNRRKAKSREKARQNDYDAVRKYQRESTSKCRNKQKEEDPELYKARQQKWRLQAKPTTKRNIMKVPKNLLKNYHRLDKFYNRSESEDEDQYGLTVWRQIKILNDNNMTDEEKSEKLNSLWNQSKKKS